MLLLLLVVVSYLLFVFISESINPFVSSKNHHKRYHKRLGVAAACASIVSGLVATGFIYFGVDERPALLVYLVLTFFLSIPALLRFKQNQFLL